MRNFRELLAPRFLSHLGAGVVRSAPATPSYASFKLSQLTAWYIIVGAPHLEPENLIKPRRLGCEHQDRQSSYLFTEAPYRQPDHHFGSIDQSTTASGRSSSAVLTPAKPSSTVFLYSRVLAIALSK